jgi:hypothetical protein
MASSRSRRLPANSLRVVARLLPCARLAGTTQAPWRAIISCCIPVIKEAFAAMVSAFDLIAVLLVLQQDSAGSITA